MKLDDTILCIMEHFNNMDAIPHDLSDDGVDSGDWP